MQLKAICIIYSWPSINTCWNKSSSFKSNLPSRVSRSGNEGGGGGGGPLIKGWAGGGGGGGGWVGGGTHYNGLYGEVPSLRVIIFRLQVCELKYVKG